MAKHHKHKKHHNERDDDRHHNQRDNNKNRQEDSLPNEKDEMPDELRNDNVVYSNVSYVMDADDKVLILYREAGDINATGNNRANRISGNAGDNILTGLGGKDVFQFLEVIGQDIITDFQDGLDKIHVSARSWNDLSKRMEQVGEDVVIHNRHFSQGSYTEKDGTITIQDVDLAQLSKADFFMFG